MKKDTFKTIIVDNQEYTPKREPRELIIPVNSSKIITITGSRRTGKTSLFYYTISQLKKKVPAENIVYVNFDDDRLYGFVLADFNLLLEAYYELYPEKKKEKVYFFFDEIQNIPEWEKFVRRIYDTEKCQIFITGSSSKLLSREIATGLRGRTITYTLFPLSFREYLKFRNIKTNIYSSSRSAAVRNAFEKYLSTGGFPELINENELRDNILREYVDMIIYKDLVERYNITNLHLIRYLVKYCLTNISTLLSMNRIFNILKSMGIKVSKNTLYEYFTYLEDAMVLYQVPVYSDSPFVQQRNPKKIYAVDIGLKKSVSFEKDRGKLFENIVFNELRRYTDDIYYYQDKQEVDFIVKLHNKKYLINVSQDIDDIETYDREIKGLFSSMKSLKLHKSFLITDYQEKMISDGNDEIHILPLWKWLLTHSLKA